MSPNGAAKTIAFVLQYIDEQKLGEGDQLPTETQLSALAGVSLVTVRRALSELSSQAIVRREQGRGTFVARPRVKAETPKIGGLRNALAAARICEAGKVKYRLGAHVGSRLVNAHAIHLAAALPQLDYACELGEFSRMREDPFAGIEVVDGMLAVPDRPGCGVDPP